MPTNSIAKIETVTLESDNGPLNAILVSLNISNLRDSEPFIQVVAENFKKQRMLSPPDTAGLLITIVGEFGAERFCELWHELVARDAIVSHFMTQMQVADVIQGTAGGQMLSSASLLTKAT